MISGTEFQWETRQEKIRKIIILYQKTATDDSGRSTFSGVIRIKAQLGI